MASTSIEYIKSKYPKLYQVVKSEHDRIYAGNEERLVLLDTFNIASVFVWSSTRQKADLWRLISRGDFLDAIIKYPQYFEQDSEQDSQYVTVKNNGLWL